LLAFAFDLEILTLVEPEGLAVALHFSCNAANTTANFFKIDVKKQQNPFK